MDNLKGGSKHRLAKMRAYVFRWNQDTRHRSKLESYIAARGHGVGSIRVDAHGPCFADDGESASVPACVLAGLRDAGMAEKILGLRHTGWFKDADASETYAGRVWQLPARDGQTQFIAGYEDKDADYCQLDASAGRLSIFATARDAAHAADDLARIHAESEREHDERWQEASRIADEREDARHDQGDAPRCARYHPGMARSTEDRAAVPGRLRDTSRRPGRSARAYAHGNRGSAQRFGPHR